MKKTIITIATCLLLPSMAAAHTLWINLYESHAHKPPHVITSLGWGHVVPMDDILEKFNMASYALVDPEMSRTELPLPQTPQKIEGDGDVHSSLGIKGGDVGVYKLTPLENGIAGVYQVVAMSKDNYYSVYLDKKGRKKWQHTTMDKVKGAKKVIEGMKFSANAKSYFAVGEWSMPKPLKLDLEILPKTDLTKLRTGDLVEFDIRLMGEPISSDPIRSLEYMTLTSNTFGGPDGFMLAALIYNGKARFRIPTSGQWVANVYTRQAVVPGGPLESLVGKCTTALLASTVSFVVQP